MNANTTYPEGTIVMTVEQTSAAIIAELNTSNDSQPAGPGTMVHSHDARGNAVAILPDGTIRADVPDLVVFDEEPQPDPEAPLAWRAGFDEAQRSVDAAKTKVRLGRTFQAVMFLNRDADGLNTDTDSESLNTFRRSQAARLSRLADALTAQTTRRRA